MLFKNVFEFNPFSDEASYSLTHWFTISWTSWDSWSDSVVQNCAVDNSKAWYLIKTGPSEELEEKKANQAKPKTQTPEDKWESI